MRPGPSELLDAVARVLKDAVQPALPTDAPAVEELRMARVILRRLAAVWDEVVPTLLEDNRDIEATLRELGEPVPEGPTELAYEAQAAHNEALQARLVELQAALREPGARDRRSVEAALGDLFDRSLARQTRLARRPSP